MGDVVARAKAAGEDYNKVFTEMEHYSHHLGKAFGISAKAISRDVGEMRMDIERFGFASVKSLTETSVQTKRLGITMKTLQGVIDKFDNFEDAARSAARLRRQFGIMIDARKMVGMSGIERLEYIKKQFAASGKDITKMGRIEMKYLKEATGMDAAQLASLTGKANKNKKLNDVKAAGAKAQAKEMSQAKSMLRLSKAIERQLQSGSTSYRSFFAAFIGGFQKGVMRSASFRKMLRTLNKSIRVVERSGRRVGRMFVKIFPGMKNMIEGLTKLFSPGRFSPFMREIEGHFKTLFEALNASPNDVGKAMDNFFSGITDSMKRFFKSGGPGASQFAEGLDVFLTVMGNIGLKLIEKTASIASDIINAMADGLQKINLSKMMSGGASAAESVGEGVADRFGTGFTNLLTTLQDKLFPALQRIFTEMIPFVVRGMFSLLEKVRNYFDENAEELGQKIGNALKQTFDVMMKLFKSMPWEAQALVLAKVFGGALIGSIVMLLPKLIMGGLVPAIKTGFGYVAGAIGGALAAPLTIAVGVGLAAADFEGGFKKKTEKLKKTFDSEIAEMAAGQSQLIDTLTFGLLPDNWIDSIGMFFGDTLTTIKKAFEDLGLGQFFKGLTEFVTGQMKIFEGLGEVIKGIFTLDKVKILNGFRNLGRGLARILKGLGRVFIGIIIGLVKGAIKVLKALPDFIASIPGYIKTAFAAVGKGIKAAFLAIGAFIEGFLLEMGVDVDKYMNSIGEAFKGAKKVITDAWDGIGYFFTSIGEKIKGIWDDIDIIGSIETAWSNVQDWIGGLVDEGKKMASNIVKGVEEGLKGLLDKLTKPFRDAADAISDIFDFGSPSKLMKKYGGWMGEGMTNGVKETLPATVNEFQTTVDQMETAANNANITPEITPMFKGNMSMDPASLLEMTQEEKLKLKIERLQDLKSLVEELNKLKGIPGDLTKLKKSFEKIDPAEIADQMTGLFDKIDLVMHYITHEVATRNYGTAAVNFDSSITDLFESLAKMRSSIDKIFSKGTMSAKTLNLRKENLVAAINGVSELSYNISGATLFTNVADFEFAAESLSTAMEGIHGKKGLFTVLPASISRKVKVAKKSIDEVGNMIAKINKSKNLKIAVALGEKMSQNGKVAISIDKTQINMDVKINIDAKKFAKQLVSVDLNPSQKGKQRLATTEDLKAAK